MDGLSGMHTADTGGDGRRSEAGAPRRVTRVVDSPLGPITMTAEGDALVALDFGAPSAATDDGAGHRSPAAERVLDDAARQLAAYFSGELREFDLPLRSRGTPFQTAVWAALREIPYGETRSYADIARRVGRPTAVRAVGRANGQNPLSIVVPCHRVIGSDGSLTGYAGGVERKRALLELERRA